MKQMTALEWLEQAIDLHLHDSLSYAGIDLHMYIKQAKMIEKQQIIDAHKTATLEAGFEHSADDWANQYYNQTFKSI